MAFTVGTTVNAGKPATAAKVVTLIDNWEFVKEKLRRRSALAYLTAATAFTTGAGKKFSWQAIEHDTDSFWSVSNPTRFTVPTGVTYARLSCGFYVESGLPEQVDFEAWKNGAAFNGSFRSYGYQFHKYMESAIVPCVAGDYFEVAFDINSASTLTFQEYLTWASIEGFSR